MRLWSLHPCYLDVKGLLAAWREGLLAQKVLEGLTKGYTHHPQLDRFRAAPDPTAAIARYLSAIADEADARGYRFAREKIHAAPAASPIPVTRGQSSYELALLQSKLELRDPAWLEKPIWRSVSACRPVSGRESVLLNSCFRPIDGGVEPWERVKRELITGNN